MATSTRTAYEFVEKPSKDYFCPVTGEILKDPRQTSYCCGHHLSRRIAEQLEAKGEPCPLCRKTPLKTTKDPYFKRVVMNLEVYCRNKPQGCQWEGKLGGLDHHLSLGHVEGQCRFVTVKCPLKCDKRIQRSKLEEHQSSECTKRPVTCKYCGITYEAAQNEDHKQNCQRFPEKCPNECSEEVERRFLQRHIEEDCPLQEIECEYAYAGCYARVERRMMQSHLDESVHTHLHKVATYGRSMISTLASAITKLSPELIFAPPPEITVDNFEKLKNDCLPWYSPPFHTHIGGYKLCLKVTASGYENREGNHVAVALCVMKGEFDSHLQWPFLGEILVHLMNRRMGGKHVSKIVVGLNCSAKDGYNNAFSRVTCGDKPNRAWGLPRFTSHADLYKPEEGKEYLKNNAIKFRVNVTRVVVSAIVHK